MYVVKKVVGSHAVRQDAPLTHPCPAYCTSGGVMILAHRPVAERDEFFRRLVLKPITPGTITDRAELDRLIAKARREGFAELRDTQVAGASGVSAPALAKSVQGGRRAPLAYSSLLVTRRI